MQALARANLKRLEGKDPVAAALASLVSSMPPSETSLPQGWKWQMPRSRPAEEWQGKGRGRMRLLERCSELCGPRRRSSYLTVNWTGRRRPNHLSGNLTGCRKNLCLRRRRGSMSA